MIVVPCKLDGVRMQLPLGPKKLFAARQGATQ
jgi:hypothetical protein